MSASLVGSEMCIRDSSPTSARVGGCRQRARELEVVVADLAVLLGSWSVSYTHLTLPTICSV
eukprot:10916183-Alexandrium_andersonii.AAC.1